MNIALAFELHDHIADDPPASFGCVFAGLLKVAFQRLKDDCLRLAGVDRRRQFAARNRRSVPVCHLWRDDLRRAWFSAILFTQAKHIIHKTLDAQFVGADHLSPTGHIDLAE